MVAVAGILLLILNIYPMVWLFLGSLGGTGVQPSLAKYGELLSSFGPIEAVKNSVIFAFFALVLGFAMAVISALSTTRLNTPFSRFIRISSVIAFVNPPWIMAMSYAWLLSPNAGIANSVMDNLFGIKPFNAFSMITMIFVASLFLYPYLYLTISSALESMDSSYEEAALASGLSPMRVLRTVTLPLVKPAMITGGIFSIIIMWGFFTIPAILGTPGKVYVFATYLYRLINTPPPDLALAAAIGVFFALTAGVLAWLGLRLARRGGAGRYHVIGGKGHRSVRMKVGPIRHVFAAFNVIVVTLALFLPYGVIFSLSIRKSIYQGFSLSNLGLDHYLDHFTGDVFREILVNTLQAAVFMSVVGIALSLVIAWTDLRGRGFVKESLTFGGTFMAAVPAVAFVIGVAWAWLRSPVILYGTMWIIILAQLARFLPLGIQHLRDGLDQLHPDLEDAARTCGAGTFDVLRSVTLPAIKPVAIATFLLLWMASMRDLLTPLFLGTGTSATSTLSQRVFFLWGEGLTGPSSALAIILVGLMGVVYVVMRLILSRSRTRGTLAGDFKGTPGQGV